ncbi:MAG: alpha/beta hydrolase [Chloroflexi bacterium]|nr:alpha/beta hydrolase [Chloroflexota bacterium]MCI0728259.1 alpha/beta hydrolase [Chloroflexota bacterium]
MNHQLVHTNGLTLHVVQDGPPAGPLVLLLHGFPDFWYGWRHQIPALAAAGYHVWAPDQRGYNLSSKPRGIAAYNLDELAADVIGLIHAAGRDRAIVIGHDWGAAVAWWLARTFPQRLERLVILNVPHGAVMRRRLRRDPAQRRRSRYIFFFQLPWLPEAVLRWHNWWTLVRGMRLSSHPGTFSAADLDHYRHAWSQPGAITAMINWYRAAVRAQPRRQRSLRVSTPTLIIWGTEDVALEAGMAHESLALCDAGQLVYLQGASHWVQHEEPTQVNHLITQFLAT